jgi:carbamoyltransferase
MAAILGISAFYHDSAAALVVDGRIVAAAHVGKTCQEPKSDFLASMCPKWG